MKVRGHGRAAFTLVEILVVILIITILMGILIPVIVAIRKNAKNVRIALELNNINTAMEGYKNKYKDYPPDFTDSRVVLRHIAKAFPRIAPLGVPPLGEPRPGIGNTWGLDPAEALVFWLGGLSDDPKHPFTGPGGPLKLVNTQNGPMYVANTERTNALFEFTRKRLSYDRINIGPTAGQMGSRDELDLHALPNPNANLARFTTADQFPVYYQEGSPLPIVYFDSRSYVVKSNVVFYPAYKPLADTVGQYGVARPYKADEPNPDFNPNVDSPDMGIHFVNRRTFQIIAPGLDESYGFDLLLPFDSPAFGQTAVPVFKLFPSGKWVHPNPNSTSQVPKGYYEGHEDNITSFSEGRILGSSVE